MNNNAVELPKKFVWAVIVVSALPFLLNQLGVDFGTTGRINVTTREFLEGADDPERWIFRVIEGDRILNGAFIHTMLEWTAFSIAIFTGAFAFIHYQVKRDVTTPIIGTALFSSGMIDVFHTLAADGLIETYADNTQFIPFTWAISRTFNVCFMIVGAGMFLRRGSEGIARTQQRGMGFVLIVAFSFALIAYSIISLCAVFPLPQAVFPNARHVPRPFDIPPLLLLLIAGGIIFPRFHAQHPSLFSHALFVSVIPQTATQLHAAFGSTALFDNHFNIAHFLKIIAYLVPLTGLMLDYTRAYQAEASLLATREKLRFARRVQQSLLPKSSPDTPGFELAGLSHPAEAVGGDYYDYVPMKGGYLGIVVADVSGHDLGASIFMAQTRAYLRALSQSTSDVSEVVSSLNRYLVDDANSRRFVTLFFARIHLDERSVLYAAQGHQAHIIRKSGEVEALHAVGPPLGFVADAKIACGPEQILEPGDLLLQLTDGIVEAKSPEGEQFGMDRSLESVISNRDKSAREIVAALILEVRSFCNSSPQIDDLTVVVLQAKEPG